MTARTRKKINQRHVDERRDFESSFYDTGFRTIPTRGDIYDPTPLEIVEAKLDGVCPRCEEPIDLHGDNGLCHKCGFSF